MEIAKMKKNNLIFSSLPSKNEGKGEKSKEGGGKVMVIVLTGC